MEGERGAKERGVVRKLGEGRESFSSDGVCRPVKLQKQLLAPAERRKVKKKMSPAFHLSHSVIVTANLISEQVIMLV